MSNVHQELIDAYKKVKSSLEDIADAASGVEKEAYQHAAMLVDYEIKYLEADDSSDAIFLG